MILGPGLIYPFLGPGGDKQEGGLSVSILNLATYLPKQCGIATFSKDLRDNLELSGRRVQIAAVSDEEYSYDYPAEVILELRQHHVEDYELTARLINTNPEIDLLIVQHEYGIYGGADGEYVLNLVNRLRKPFLVVAHTVLPQPSTNQLRVLKELAGQASAVVCMSTRSARLLSSVFSVPAEKLFIIHHGVPVFPKQDREALKQLYGLQGNKIITTFGLIGPGKGLENGIRAISRILTRHPRVHYLIVGQTHPMLLKREGESYRDMLKNLIDELNLKGRVSFVNRFLSLEELGDYLSMSDIYLSPYPNMNQAVSGTMAFALGCGRAIVSTPYEYALEMLQGGKRGVLALSPRPDHLAAALTRVLDDEQVQAGLERSAERMGKRMLWPYVAEQYGLLAERVAPRLRRDPLLAR
jgi:glycosyltransferase involved in cell wall biosynthesis